LENWTKFEEQHIVSMYISTVAQQRATNNKHNISRDCSNIQSPSLSKVGTA